MSDEVIIRAAEMPDIPTIARLGEEFHRQARWDEIPYSVEDCMSSLFMFMQSDAFECYVAVRNGEIVGMIAGIISPVYFNRSHVSGEELFWWVSDDASQMTGLRLLQHMEDVGRKRGCQTWQMKSLARLGGDRMQKLYERRGYRACERLFIKEL